MSGPGGYRWAKPGSALQPASSLIDSIFKYFFPLIPLQRRHAQTGLNGASSQNQNHMTGSQITAILMNRLIFPFGGIAS